MRWQLWLSSLVSGSLQLAAVPLTFEYAAELSYPVPEGVVGAFMAMLNNAIAFCFLALFFVPFKSVVHQYSFRKFRNCWLLLMCCCCCPINNISNQITRLMAKIS